MYPGGRKQNTGVRGGDPDAPHITDLEAKEDNTSSHSRPSMNRVQEDNKDIGKIAQLRAHYILANQNISPVQKQRNILRTLEEREATKHSEHLEMLRQYQGMGSRRRGEWSEQRGVHQVRLNPLIPEKPAGPVRANYSLAIPRYQDNTLKMTSNGDVAGIPVAGLGTADYDFAAIRQYIGNASTGRKKSSDEDVAGIPLRDKSHLQEPKSTNIPSVPQMPPIVVDRNTPHYSERTIIPFAIEEDVNWLSERHVFLRAELLEVVRRPANLVVPKQPSDPNIPGIGRVKWQVLVAGARCRFCAHLNPTDRQSRSYAFPSSINQLYRSFNMMIREHFQICPEMPPAIRKRFLRYERVQIGGSSQPHDYLHYAAAKIGMVDTEYGIAITEESLESARNMRPFGTDAEYVARMSSIPGQPVIEPSDRSQISPYVYTVLSQAQKCDLVPAEYLGKRGKELAGMPGFGCRLCCQKRRLGACRVFPQYQRAMFTKIDELHRHLIRCPLVSSAIKALLKRQREECLDLKSYPDVDSKRIWMAFSEKDQNFIRPLWFKLGFADFFVREC